MRKAASYSEARANLASLWDQVVQTRGALTIHRRGAGDVVLVAADEFESLLETVCLLRSPRNAERLFSALNRVKRGQLSLVSVNNLRGRSGLPKAD